MRQHAFCFSASCIVQIVCLVSACRTECSFAHCRTIRFLSRVRAGWRGQVHAVVHQEDGRLTPCLSASLLLE
jgi:hypothetical protein